ncbi:MAG TPA: LysR family transcriptional regulator [Acidimicrobiales bacterium]|nr:LysR family transcriptional regulator [Acidimicrobiales bacterium]
MQSEPDLNLLILLDALLSEGSVTGAARRLNLSVPATSRGLERVRRALGDPVMVRAGRGLVPTPRALALQAEVHELVNGARAVMARPAELDLARIEREFQVMTGDLVFPVATLIERVHREAPRATCGWSVLTGSTVLLRDSPVDLVIGVVRDFHPVSQFEPEVVVEPLRTDPLVGIARAGNPLLEGEIDLESYLAADHLVNSRQGRLQGPIDHKLAEMGRKRHVVASTATLWSTVVLLLETDIVGAASLRVAHTLERFGLATFELPFDKVPTSELCQAWHPRYAADQAHAWLRGVVREIATAPE